MLGRPFPCTLRFALSLLPCCCCCSLPCCLLALDYTWLNAGKVDLLVLDRTFASLSGVAQRLMGGWTKWAIWGFTGWKADVAADYLFTRCYKASMAGAIRNYALLVRPIGYDVLSGLHAWLPRVHQALGLNQTKRVKHA